jgi:hypothetical protein
VDVHRRAAPSRTRVIFDASGVPRGRADARLR